METRLEPQLIWETSQVKVWSGGLDLPSAALRLLYQTLSTNEQARAQRYGTALLQDRFIARRGLLRALLGEELTCSPCGLRFHEPKFRKPTLVSGEVSFSVSSSQEFAVFAFSRTQEVGVDIERVDPDLPPSELTALTQDHFSREEKALLSGMQEPERIATFFRAWTCKEACAKAIGVGLSLPLAHYDVLSAKNGTRKTTLGDFSTVSLPLPSSLKEAYCASLAMTLSVRSSDRDQQRTTDL